MVNVRVDQPVKVTLELQASAQVHLNLSSNRQGPGHGEASAHFGHTLRWGGITSVVDSATGQPIESWAVTSDTGFDYSKPFVPEPASAVLLLLGVPFVVGRRVRCKP